MRYRLNYALPEYFPVSRYLFQGPGDCQPTELIEQGLGRKPKWELSADGRQTDAKGEHC